MIKVKLKKFWLVVQFWNNDDAEIMRKVKEEILAANPPVDEQCCKKNATEKDEEKEKLPRRSNGPEACEVTLKCRKILALFIIGNKTIAILF